MNVATIFAAAADKNPARPLGHGADPQKDRLALGLLALVTLSHVIYAGSFALSPQEAYYFAWSRRLDLSYFDHPPLVAYTIWFFTHLFGDSERAVRLAAAFHSTLFAGFFWATARRLFDSRVALLSLGICLCVPLFAIGQVIITPDGPLVSGWAMALYFTVKALDEEDGRALLAAGAACGFALLGKYTGVLLFPQIFLVLLLDPRGRRLLRTGWPYAGVALALFLFLPVVLWNARRSFAGFAFQTTGRLAGLAFRPERVAGFLGLQAAIVTPVVFLTVLFALGVSFRRRKEPPFRVAFWFSAPLLLATTAVSAFEWVKGNWLAPAYPGALMAWASLATEAPRSAFARVLRPAWVTALCASLYLHLVFLGPLLPFPAKDELILGWRDLASRVAILEAKLGPRSFAAGCSYKVASELGYYLPGRPRTFSSEIAGGEGLEYRVWFDPAELKGREGIVVEDAREPGGCKRLAEACASLTPLEPFVVRRGSATVTTFRIWRCLYRGLSGTAPAER